MKGVFPTPDTVHFSIRHPTMRLKITRHSTLKNQPEIRHSTSTRMEDPHFFRLWKAECRMSGLIVECRVTFSLSARCWIEKMDHVGCQKTPLKGTLFTDDQSWSLIGATLTQILSPPLKVCSGRRSQTKKVICEVCFLADFWHKTTVKQVIFLSATCKNSPMFLIGVLDLNRPLIFWSQESLALLF